MPSLSCCRAYVYTRMSSYQSLISSLLSSNPACLVGNSCLEQLCLLIAIAEVLQMYALLLYLRPSPEEYMAMVGLPFDRMG